MLVGGGTPAEPSVIGDVHHEPGTCTNGFPHQVAKDGIVADKRRPQEGAVHGSFLSGNKVPLAQIHVVQDWEDVVERNPFAERNQVLFDVTLGEASVVRAEQERGVVHLVAAHCTRLLDALEIKGANQNASVHAACDVVQPDNRSGLPTDVVWNGGFSQDNQVGSVFDAVPYHTEGLVDNAVVALLAPFFTLLNAGLHHGYLGGVLPVASVEGCRFGGGQGDFSVNK